MLAGQYVIGHPELSSQNHPAFLQVGTTTLSHTGNLIFMADIQSAIHKVDPEYHSPDLAQVQTRASNDAKIQASQVPTRQVTLW